MLVRSKANEHPNERTRSFERVGVVWCGGGSADGWWLVGAIVTVDGGILDVAHPMLRSLICWWCWCWWCCVLHSTVTTFQAALKDRVAAIEPPAASSAFLSLQEAYALLGVHGVAAAHYVVYSHLRSLGFIVRPLASATCDRPAGAVVPVFEVFRPNAKFKRSAPGPPAFQLAIVSYVQAAQPDRYRSSSRMRARKIDLIRVRAPTTTARWLLQSARAGGRAPHSQHWRHGSDGTAAPVRRVPWLVVVHRASSDRVGRNDSAPICTTNQGLINKAAIYSPAPREEQRGEERAPARNASKRERSDMAVSVRERQ